MTHSPSTQCHLRGSRGTYEEPGVLSFLFFFRFRIERDRPFGTEGNASQKSQDDKESWWSAVFVVVWKAEDRKVTLHDYILYYLLRDENLEMQKTIPFRDNTKRPSI